MDIRAEDIYEYAPFAATLGVQFPELSADRVTALISNSSNGTRYLIRPTSLTIAPSDGKASTETVLEYATS